MLLIEHECWKTVLPAHMFSQTTGSFVIVLFSYFSYLYLIFVMKSLTLTKKSNTAKILPTLDYWYWPSASNRNWQILKWQAISLNITGLTYSFQFICTRFFFFWDFVTLHVCNGRKEKMDSNFSSSFFIIIGRDLLLQIHVPTKTTTFKTI